MSKTFGDGGGYSSPPPGDRQASINISVRDYFAAHAPEMPKWFHRQMEVGPEGTYFAWRWHYADMMVRGREKS